MDESCTWVARAKSGDAEAFAKLYKEVYESLYRYALYAVGRPADAEDAVAETVIAAYRQIGALKKEEAFRRWIFAILANQCRAILRKRYRTSADSMEEGQERTPAEDHIGTDDEAIEALPLLEWMTAHLSDEEREIIALHLLAGYTSQEIAERMQTNASTVRSKERRALQRLRKEWDR